MTEDYWGGGYWGNGYFASGYFGQGGTITPTPTVATGNRWIGSPARMALPKRKLQLIKLFLEAEMDE